MKQITFALLIILSVFTLSCKKKEVEDLPAPGNNMPLFEQESSDVPSVTIYYGGTTYSVGGNFYMSIEVTSINDLQKIEITKKLGANAPVLYQEVTSGFDGAKAHSFSLNAYTVENFSPIVFSITATDTAGKTTTVDCTITVNP